MSNASRLRRGTLPCLLALCAATVFALPASAASGGASRASEWWLTALNVSRAWRAAPAEGRGVIVAVLSSGVDATQPDLTGDVTIGRDYCGSGRTAGSQFWGYEGTAVASLVAGHGHGGGDADGITGIAPYARILAVQVTLEYNDPLNSDPAITRRLPAAIAAGIRYAVAQGATVIALPLDPATLGPVATGDPVASGGSAAERAAVDYALARNVVLIAPAGDNGASTGTVNYPAAYPGVVAVGATERGGQLTPFTSTRSYVALTAPGSGLTVADPDGGYSTLASTDMSAALTAGVAALIRSRFPGLTAAEVARALEAGTRSPGKHPAPGSGHGALDAAGALAAAGVLAAPAPGPAPTPRPAAPSPSPHVTPHLAATRPAGLGTLAGSLVRYAVIAAGALIAALAAALALTATRRRRAESMRRAQAGQRPGQGSHARRSRTATARPSATGQQGTSLWTQQRPNGNGGPRIVRAPVIGTLGAAGRAQRKRRTAETPPWGPASLPEQPPPAVPAVGHLLPRALPAAPSPGARPSSALAPWEASPEEFAAAPVPTDPPDWAVNSGPMYVWNPNSSTAPQPVIRSEAED